MLVLISRLHITIKARTAACMRYVKRCIDSIAATKITIQTRWVPARSLLPGMTVIALDGQRSILIDVMQVEQQIHAEGNYSGRRLDGVAHIFICQLDQPIRIAYISDEDLVLMLLADKHFMQK